MSDKCARDQWWIYTGITQPQDVSTNVNVHTTSVLERITSLRSSADTLRQQAEALYRNAAQELPTLNDMQFKASVTPYRPGSPKVTDAPTIPSIGAISKLNLKSPSLQLDSFQQSNITAPTVESLQFPIEPPLNAQATAPLDLSLADLPPIPNVPTIDVIVQPVDAIDGVAQLTLPDIDISMLEPQQLVLPDIPPLPALAGVQSVASNRFKRVKYDKHVIDDALAKVMSVFTSSNDVGVPVEDLNLAQEQLWDTTIRPRAMTRIASTWVRRGFSDRRSSDRAVFASDVVTRYAADATLGRKAVRRRVRMKMYPEVLQLATLVQEQLAKMYETMIELDFEQLLVEREALFAIAQTVREQLQLKFQRYMVFSQQYRAQLLQVKTAVETYLANVKIKLAKSQKNTAIAQAYALQQEAKMTQVQLLEVYYRAARAAVAAYNAQIQAVQAKAQAASAEYSRFVARSQKWLTELVRAEADYAINKARNRAIIAENQMAAVKVALQGARADVVASNANLAATLVAKDVAQLRAELAQRIAQNTAAQAQNNVAAVNAKNISLNENVRSTVFNSDMRIKATEYSVLDAINDGITSVTAQATNAAIQVSKDIQQKRIQLAEAYVDMYKTLADAEAATLAGRAAALRADVRVNAAATVQMGYSTSAGHTVSTALSNSDAQDCVTLIRPITY